MSGEVKTIAQLKSELAEIESRANALRREESRKRDELASAIADSIGLHVGSIITTERNQALGRKAKVRRYVVTSFNYREYSDPPLRLFGQTLRKDGKKGERSNIWQDWKLEGQTK